MSDAAPTRTLLIIDDDPGIRELVGGRADVGGYTVLTAAGGRSGLEQATAARPGLILLDASLQPRLGPLGSEQGRF